MKLGKIMVSALIALGLGFSAAPGWDRIMAP